VGRLGVQRERGRSRSAGEPGWWCAGLSAEVEAGGVEGKRSGDLPEVQLIAARAAPMTEEEAAGGVDGEVTRA
jgi:hypothetical protein